MLLDLEVDLLVSVLAADGGKLFAADGARDPVVALVGLQVPRQVPFPELLVADVALGVLKKVMILQFNISINRYAKPLSVGLALYYPILQLSTKFSHQAVCIDD